MDEVMWILVGMIVAFLGIAVTRYGPGAASWIAGLSLSGVGVLIIMAAPILVATFGDSGGDDSGGSRP